MYGWNKREGSSIATIVEQPVSATPSKIRGRRTSACRWFEAQRTELTGRERTARRRSGRADRVERVVRGTRTSSSSANRALVLSSGRLSRKAPLNDSAQSATDGRAAQTWIHSQRVITGSPRPHAPPLIAGWSAQRFSSLSIDN